MNVMSSSVVPTTGAATPAAEQISYSIATSALGELLVARSATGVCSIQFGRDRQKLEAELAAEFPDARLITDDDAVRDDLANILDFIERPAKKLHLALDLRGTVFQRRVWEMLLTIPTGTTLTYSELADRLGMPGSARAVASACAANRLAVAVPCHRVVRSDGELAGYRWGIERKRSLVGKEAAA
ncbi:methylated-DNA--[protein]-cysteine S-methyltransferase [Sphingomonas sp. PR090111-T3T-6A]|uniref:methylated-DNA--[protein]-cysteine S-methyltransferase n=1 Tax=Sphingomonas sp. PR090111-T3T-6A TaxID=685778 RepID=UPI000375595D|nr:methylated-DNA--[protein]-cysteine S-methyltransferase [Sphingomonas sp. PR090111-T3T-6A]